MEFEMTRSPATSHSRPEDSSRIPQSPLNGEASPDGMPSDATHNSSDNEHPSSTNGDDDTAPTKHSRTGLAAQLIRQAETDESEPEEEVDGKTAYQLMRQRLLRKRQEAQKEHVSDNARNSTKHLKNITSPNDQTLSHMSPARSPQSSSSRSQSPQPPTVSPIRMSKPRTDVPISPDYSPDHPSRHNTSLDSDSSEADKSRIHSRVQELVAKKRAERLAKEEEHRTAVEDAHEGDVSPKITSGKIKRRRVKILETAETDSDEQGSSGRKLTQEARPTRKASKKALEEMNRETQRISRNQQLAHSVQTKKKIRKEDFFARFNFRTLNAAAQKNERPTTPGNSSASALNSAPVSSDVELGKATETPPSSPPTAQESKTEAPYGNGVFAEQETDHSYLVQEDGEEGLAPLDEMLSQPSKKVDKGKAPIRGDISLNAQAELHPKEPKRQIRAFRVIPPSVSKPSTEQHSDSGDDIEIIGKRFAVFDKMPTNKKTEAHAMKTLRALAHLKSPSKTRARGKSWMTPSELQALLSKRARDQARKERDERLDELRAKGVYIPTEEEKQKEQLLVENLLEKARQEAQELSKMEKDAAKNNGDDEGDGLPSSDEEYQDENSQTSEEEVEEKVVELSGSEDEDAAEDAEDADNEDNLAEGNEFLADEAEDSDGDESLQNAAEEPKERQADAPEQASDNEASIAPVSTRVRVRNNRIVDDDDDDEVESPSPNQLNDVPSGTFNLGLGSASAPLSMTQMFAATMDAELSQPQENGATETEQDSMAFLRQLPPPTLPDFDAAMAQFTQSSIVLNTQAETPQKPGQDNQAKEPTPATVRTAKYAATEYSEVPDPTQDFGFELSRSPRRGEPMPQSTVDTVVLSQSPQIKQWSRLRRKAEVNDQFSDVDDEGVEQDREVNDDDGFAISANAFDVLRIAAKKTSVATFDRNKSEAKGMFEEPAEESEDEYAGLGGASDDESGGEDEEVKKMIDESEIKLNKHEMAAFFANKERQRDEKEVEKLYRDIANGGLRRKRGAEFDLSDSDDDVEARRRRRQRENARHMKALLQDDENLGKIAENPKKAAFLRAIEDRDSEDEVYHFDEPGRDVPLPDSQFSNDTRQGSSETQVPASNEAALKRKQPNDDSFVRPPAQLRRTNKGKKPSNLAEVRETLSFLIDDQQSVPETPISESESEHISGDNEEASETTEQVEDEIESTRPPAKLPRTAPLESRRSSGNPIIDRLSLKRSSSSILSDSENAAGLAFHASNQNEIPGFKVPSLLRRATTISSTVSASSEVAKSRASAATDEAGRGVRRGGTKKSSINYAAREAERRSIIEEAERKRKEGVRKVAGMRRGVLRGLGGVSGGFD